MKKIFTPAICVFILMISAASCKKDKDNCVDGSVNFPFMATGHISVYFLEYFGAYDTMTYAIGAKINGKYEVTNSTAEGTLPTNTGDWWACSKDYYTTFANSSDDGGHWFFSLNSNVGDTWTQTESSTIITYQLLSKNASVTTLNVGQTFTNCYEFTYYQQNTINVDTIYFRPDWGLVYYNGLITNYELIKKNF